MNLSYDPPEHEMQYEWLNVRIFSPREIYFVLSEAGRFPRGPAFSLFYCTDQDESLLTLDANGDGAKDLLCYSFSEERYSLLFNRFVSTWWAPPSRGGSLYCFQPLGEGLKQQHWDSSTFESAVIPDLWSLLVFQTVDRQVVFSDSWNTLAKSKPLKDCVALDDVWSETSLDLNWSFIENRVEFDISFWWIKPKYFYFFFE